MEKRTRNWVTVVYPESASCDWINILREQCVPAFVSPIHDLDLNKDGTKKKEHYHVMILFDGVKTRAQAKEVFDAIGGIGIEPVKSVRGYARYLCHIDDPEKAQYSMNDVIECAGADYQSTINLPSDKYAAIGEMLEFTMENDIDSYAQLLLYAKKYREDWFRVLCDSGTLTMVQFLKSKSWKRFKIPKKDDGKMK